ncbi:putative transmembrane protein [Gregarina niphandrodes]|uniref:Transmembrane protein n=1 Tax=Gregarina niphandrodes TaxID=110365 RepID=A0A023BCX1_GRENI|nr:putative transmembrane protein [Gregarina niphandrodes]EZG86309.1 putative transmembrane protein [Gregarina niphandrodes]|eukprot:XP_011128760.1 putative transmembrane protein [Gregarina niphandrodes]
MAWTLRPTTTTTSLPPRRLFGALQRTGTELVTVKNIGFDTTTSFVTTHPQATATNTVLQTARQNRAGPAAAANGSRRRFDQNGADTTTGLATESQRKTKNLETTTQLATVKNQGVKYQGGATTTSLYTQLKNADQKVGLAAAGTTTALVTRAPAGKTPAAAQTGQGLRGILGFGHTTTTEPLTVQASQKQCCPLIGGIVLGLLLLLAILGAAWYFYQRNKPYRGYKQISANEEEYDLTPAQSPSAIAAGRRAERPDTVPVDQYEKLVRSRL